MTAPSRVALVLALVASCRERACREPADIRAERIANEPGGERTSLAVEPRGLWTRPADPPPNECEPGDVGECLGIIRPIRGPMHACPCTHCRKMRDGAWRWNRAECNTPLVVAFDDRPVAFTRADASFAVGVSDRTEWVSAETPWLALDRDGSGCIDGARELFAGFDALRELDANGDGVLDAGDPAFAELVLWSDRDQDKRCTPDELAPLAIASLPLRAVSPAVIPTGSYEGDTAFVGGGARVVDVHLAPLDQGSVQTCVL